MFLGSLNGFEIVPQILLPKINQMLDIKGINTWKKIICVHFEATVQSKISSICTNSENMLEIDQNVP